MPSRIRVVALGLVYRDDEVLVSRLSDPETGEEFYRPLGGGVEFGEHSREAVAREFFLELGVSFVVEEHVDTVEDIFTFDGERAHEVWRVYRGHLEDEWPYERDELEAREPELDERFVAVWTHPDEFRGGETFYPEGPVPSL